MRLTRISIIAKAVAWHRNSYITLSLVVALIAAVITASLLAGHSVRETLKKNTLERLNGSGLMVSAGLRYSDRDVAVALYEKLGVTIAPLMEVNGRVSGFGGDLTVNGAKIWGVDSSFFLLGGYDPAGETPVRGEAVLNGRLADALQVKEGEFVIVRFDPPSDIPNHTPFAPSKDEEGSLFLTVKKIVRDESYALFNPSISQIIPYNIFVNIDEFNQFLQSRRKANRFMIAFGEGQDSRPALSEVEEALADVAFPGGQSLRFRTVKATGDTEIISDRIFIDEFIVSELTAAIPDAHPIITYLANNIVSESGATPYSFIAAVPDNNVPMLTSPYDIAVNSWLASDLGCKPGDTLMVTYYVTGNDNRLYEDTARFRVAQIVPLSGVWRDSMLMPEFPGITGASTCTEWDTGIPLDMKSIRDKDEDYWFDHAGTPKAFIRYKTGAALWGNQFGPATSIRFKHHLSTPAGYNPTPEGYNPTQEGYNPTPAGNLTTPAGLNIHSSTDAPPPIVAAGDINPAALEDINLGTFGFTINDLRAEGLKAATSGVDFSTLFLALSFFIVGSALVLLIMITDNHLRSREGEMAAYTALGFTKRKIRLLFVGEASLPVIVGAAAGTAAGILFNGIIIKALNSVWIGAVQTDTLSAFTGAGPLLTGFITTSTVTIAAAALQINSFLKRSGESVRDREVPDGKLTTLILSAVLLSTTVTFLLIAFTSVNPVMLWFIAGTLLFIALILAVRWLVTRRFRKHLLSLRYYAFWPARAVTPVLFIAAGLFIVISTGANRQDFGREAMNRTSGTGGFTHWIETSIPVGPSVDLTGSGTIMRCLRVDGDDASCLNLNFITSPHLLGVDAAIMAERGSFSFATTLKNITGDSPWEALLNPAGKDAIYGFLDQTVMQWGMKVTAGDTVTIRSESGRPLHVIIAGGFKTSIFQGHLVIDKSHFFEWFPSVSGSTILLADTAYSTALNRTGLTTSGSDQTSDVPTLASYGAIFETTTARLQSFYRVTNTYLSVFTVLGAIGMILGVTGMGLNLLRNIRSRRRELALMTATGFTTKAIRRMLLKENLAILTAGVLAGTLPAVIATWPSLSTGNSLPWTSIFLLALLLLVVGTVATALAIKKLTREKIVSKLKEGK